MLKNPVFSCSVNQQFFTFLSFMNICRSSRSQIFFKIGALNSFAIFWINKSLQYRYFPVNIAKFLKTPFLQNFSGGCFCIILKVIKQLFCKGYLKNINKCPSYDVLTIFFLNTSFDIQKVELVLLQICRQFPGFLYNSIRVYSIKLKIGMLYHMSNTFRNTIF